MAQPESTAARIINILALGQAETPILVNAESVSYSKSFPLFRGMTYAWDVRFTSSGSVNVKVELEQGNVRPATEGAADTTDWSVPDNKVASPMIAAVTDEVAHNVAYSPNATGFARLKLTGISGNHSTTTLALAKASCIES